MDIRRAGEQPGTIKTQVPMKGQRLTLKFTIYLLGFIAMLIFTDCNRVVKDYDFEGRLLTKCKTSWPSGNLNGKCVYFHKDGSISDVYMYKKGKLNGISTSYYEEGGVRHVVEYKNDNLWNVIEYYDLQGNKLDFGTLNNGTGELMVYGITGKLRGKGTLKEGLRHGWWYIISNRGIEDSTLFINGYGENENSIANFYFH